MPSAACAAAATALPGAPTPLPCDARSRFLADCGTLLGVGGIAFAARRQHDLGDLIPGSAAVTAALLGVALLVAASAQRSAASIDRRLSLVMLAAAAAMLATHPSWIAVLAGAAMFVWAVAAVSRSTKVALAAEPALLAMGCVWLALEGASLLSLRGTELPWVGEIAAAVAGTAGAWPAGAGDGGLVVGALRGNRPYLMLPEVAGTMTLGACVAFAVLDAAVRRRGWALVGSTARTVAAAVGAMVVRVLLVVGVGNLLDTLVEYDEPDFPAAVFLDWRVVLGLDLAALVAMAVGLSLLRTTSTPARNAVLRPIPVGPHATRLAVGALVAGALLASGRALDWFGAKDRCTVIVDEGHSDWERSDLPLDEDSYGDETGYNFSACVKWVAGSVGPVRRLYEPVSAGTLRGHDVLVLKTPTRPFGPAERAAIEDFVEEGGGLVLIGDHTNVFGTSEVLNDVASAFGIAFRYDVFFDERARFEHVWRPEMPSDLHPVNLAVDRIRFEVGCSLVCTRIGARSVMVARGMKTLPIDYGASNFYPQIRDDSGMLHGRITDVVALTHGAGRVVAISDSTLFSTFSVCYPGRRELFAGAVRWAAGDDVGETLRTVLWGCGAALLAACVILARGGPYAGLALCATVATMHLTQAAPAAWADWREGRAASAEECPEVLFLSESNSTVFWPVDQLVRDHDRSFDMFFQWVHRGGLFPRLVSMGDLVPDAPATLFVIEPRPLGDEEVERLIGIARSGGFVVFVEAASNDGVRAGAAAAGMDLDDASGAATPEDVECAFGTAANDAPTGRWRPIRGGEPILVAGDSARGNQRTFGAVSRVGEGWVGVITCGRLFTDIQYGFRYNVFPQETLRRRYAVEYALLRACGASSRTELE